MHSSAQSPPMTSLLSWSGSQGSGESHWPPEDLDVNQTQALLALRRGRPKPGSMVGAVEQKLDLGLHSPVVRTSHAACRSPAGLWWSPGSCTALPRLFLSDTTPTPTPLLSSHLSSLPSLEHQASSYLRHFHKLFLYQEIHFQKATGLLSHFLQVLTKIPSSQWGLSLTILFKITINPLTFSPFLALFFFISVITK